MRNTFLFTLTVLFLSQIGFAQMRHKSEFTALQQQSDNLDSLVHIWHIKRSINNKETLKVSSVPDFLMKEVTDSVYISRLERIPSIMPLTYNDKVKKWIELYIRKHKRTPYLIGLSDYYFPIFEEILDSYELPIELKYLAIIESALNPRAKSRAGAVGLWQFIYSTGKMYGLEINSYVDERCDPLKSTHAAASYLKDMYEVYGNWELVMAAYNCGPGNVNKAIRRSGGSKDYWDIYPFLPRETRGYVPAFTAALYTMTYYNEHNIRPIKVDMNLFTDTVMITERVHLRQVAEVLNLPYDELVEINPQYRKKIIPGNSKAYPLRLPVKETSNFITLSETIFNYSDDKFVLGKQVVVKSPKMKGSKKKSSSKKIKKNKSSSKKSETASKNTPSSTKGKTKIVYTVKSGDCYGSIASKYNVKISKLKRWNGKRSNRLDIGQKLDIWVSNKNTTKKKQKRYSKKASIARSNKIVWYKIKSGDNLNAIAKKYPGVSENDIKKINGFSSRDLKRLQIGQIIKIKNR